MADGMSEVATQPRAEPLDNPRHERFCLEYVKDFNAQDAYIRTGFSPKGAKQSAARLLTNADLILRVQYLVDRRSEKLNFEGERVMLETARLAMSDIRDVMEVTADGDVVIFASEDWTDHAARAVESVKVTQTFNKNGDVTSKLTVVKMHSKIPALSLLSHQIGIIGKGAKNKPLRPEELGIVILPRLADEPDWDAIEDGDPRYSLAQPPQE